MMMMIFMMNKTNECRMCIPISFHTVFMSNEYKRFMGCQIFSNQIDHYQYGMWKK